MRVAVPLFDGNVAPRFCAADLMMVVDVDERTELSRAIVPIESNQVAQRLVKLAELGVRALLCGGFNRHYLPMAARLGIAVTWGLRGPALDAIEAFLAGELPRASILTPPACAGDNIEGTGAGRWRILK